eukprot:gene18083-biopygen8379
MHEGKVWEILTQREGDSARHHRPTQLGAHARRYSGGGAAHHAPGSRRRRRRVRYRAAPALCRDGCSPVGAGAGSGAPLNHPVAGV